MWNCSASDPAYVYSVGSSLVLVDVVIDDRHSDNIRAWRRVVLSERARVQALATHTQHALVYFSDTDTGVIYRTNHNQWQHVTELTVQQPHVEGRMLAYSVWIYVNVGLVSVFLYLSFITKTVIADS